MTIQGITLKIAQSIARANGMSIRKTSAGDYRVNFIGAKEDYAVYESSAYDALLTAQYMFEDAIKRSGGKRYWVV